MLRLFDGITRATVMTTTPACAYRHERRSEPASTQAGDERLKQKTPTRPKPVGAMIEGRMKKAAPPWERGRSSISSMYRSTLDATTTIERKAAEKPHRSGGHCQRRGLRNAANVNGKSVADAGRCIGICSGSQAGAAIVVLS